MAGNSFGTLFRITTFGESHGKGVGVVIDGVPAGMPLSETDIQPDLDRRKPGQSSVTTPRKESDTAIIQSGVFEGKTTGTPIMVLMLNTDVKSSDYNNLKDIFRPGHADKAYYQKYGIRDWRGSGRASGRETAGRVAAGAVAKKILRNKGITIFAYTKEAGGIVCEDFDPSVIERNPMRACDIRAAEMMVQRVEEARGAGDSIGGVVECRVTGMLPGLGEPVFDKLEADLAKGILSIGAVRGFEIGSGFNAAKMKGSVHNDTERQCGFLTNNAGGVSGGISTGKELLFRAAVKPTASIEKRQQGIDIHGNEVDIEIKGRHDPVLCPRIVPVVEAMTALVVVDHLLRNELSQFK